MSRPVSTYEDPDPFGWVWIFFAAHISYTDAIALSRIVSALSDVGLQRIEHARDGLLIEASAVRIMSTASDRYYLRARSFLEFGDVISESSARRWCSFATKRLLDNLTQPFRWAIPPNHSAKRTA